MPDVDAILKRYDNLKRKQDQWIPTYEILAQYILMRKLNFKSDIQSGPFVFNLNYDGTAVNAARVMAASIFGQVWPSASESFQFLPEVAQAGGFFEDDTFEFFQDVNVVLATQLSRPECGYLTALQEAITDLIVFGTGAIYVIDTGEIRQPLRFKALDAKSIVFDEDEAGAVNTAFIMHRLTVATAVAKYGYENCSKDLQGKYNNKQFDQTVNVVQAILPRMQRDPMKTGNRNFAFASIHIDVSHDKHVLMESGFQEMPVIGMRFYKVTGEVLGRSPAMDAISDIKELNKEAELFTKAGEFALDPPRAIAHEQTIGGYPKWKAGAWIPIHTSGRLGSEGRPPIEALHTVKNPSWARERIVDLREQVREHFLLDRLTDLNNRSRQTLGEADIRNQLRSAITGPVLNRVLLEGIQPTLDRSFNILLERGFFGVVKGSMEDYQMQAAGIQPKYLSESFINARLSGVKGYITQFICPAARAAHQEEITGMLQLEDFLIKVGPIRPDLLDLFNFDEWGRRKHFISGASLKILNSDAQVQQLRQQAAEAQLKAQQEAEIAGGAEVLKSAGQGLKAINGGANAA
jgi:hypothetical protein